MIQFVQMTHIFLNIFVLDKLVGLELLIAKDLRSFKFFFISLGIEIL